MKAIIDCYEYDFANQVARLAIDTGRPIIKNVNATIVIYLRSEVEQKLFEKQLYEKANRYKRAYNSVKFKKHTPILDRRYKNKR
jgi:hypothetical protein